MTQNQMILEYMREHGSITQQEAYLKLSCMRLPSRIFDLRKQGYKIISTTARGLNSSGKKVTFAKYELLEDEENA